MPIKYELYDKENPKDRGQRFSTIERAEKELAHAYPQSRFAIRQVGRK